MRYTIYFALIRIKHFIKAYTMKCTSSKGFSDYVQLNPVFSHIKRVRYAIDRIKFNHRQKHLHLCNVNTLLTYPIKFVPDLRIELTLIPETVEEPLTLNFFDIRFLVLIRTRIQYH